MFRLPGAASVSPADAVAFGFDLMPVEGGADMVFHAPVRVTTEVTLMDVLGRPVQSFTVPAGTSRLRIVDVRQGAFLISVVSGGERTTRRWIQG